VTIPRADLDTHARISSTGTRESMKGVGGPLPYRSLIKQNGNADGGGEITLEARQQALDIRTMRRKLTDRFRG